MASLRPLHPWIPALALAGILGPTTRAPTPEVQWLPFRFVGHHIYLQGFANRVPLWLLLDTGATSSFIDPAVAERVGALPVEGRVAVRLRLADGPSWVQRLGLYPLGYSEFDGHSVDALLGYDFLKDFAIEIDYARRRLRLHPAAGYQIPATFETIQLRLLEDDSGGKLPLATVMVTAADSTRISGEFIIDTGARGNAVLAAPFGRQHQWFRPDAPRLAPLLGSGSLVKNLRAPVGRVGSLALGPFPINGAVVAIAQDTAGILSATEFAGIVGGELLSRFTVVFDYRSQRLGLRPNPSFNAPSQFDQCGCTLVASDGRIQVADVLPGSPASEAGLTVGDFLLRVNGKLAKPRELDGLRLRFRTAANHQLTIRRQERLLHLTLTTRELLPAGQD